MTESFDALVNQVSEALTKLQQLESLNKLLSQENEELRKSQNKLLLLIEDLNKKIKDNEENLQSLRKNSIDTMKCSGEDSTNRSSVKNIALEVG